MPRALPSFPPRFFVRAGESVQLEERMVHAWALEHLVMAAILATLIFGTTVVIDLTPRTHLPAPVYFITGSLAVLLLGLTALWVWRRIATTEYVVSNETVYTRRGILLLRVNSAPLDRITDQHVHTSLIGRLFGYSDLLVRTAGGGLHLPGLRDAYHVRGLIHERRSAYIGRLLAESGQPKAPRPRAVPSEAADHCLCPRCQFAIPVGPLRPAAVVCPHCRLEGVLFSEAVA